jgi:hypothetical protein
LYSGVSCGAAYAKFLHGKIIVVEDDVMLLSFIQINYLVIERMDCYPIVVFGYYRDQTKG